MLTKIFLIIWLHFIADFLLQSDKMATNIKWLGIHSVVYSIPFLLFGINFALITCGSHFVVDYITSKVTKYFWEREQRHWFFVTIGFDQVIHLSIFLIMLKYL